MSLMICIQEVNLVLRVVTLAGSFALLGSVKLVLYNMLFHLHNALKFTPIVCCEVGCCGQQKLATIYKTSTVKHVGNKIVYHKATVLTVFWLGSLRRVLCYNCKTWA